MRDESRYDFQKILVFQLLSCLEDPPVAETAASGFGVILEDCPEVLNFKSHAVIRIMYKQRFFQETEPKLIKGFNSAKPGT